MSENDSTTNLPSDNDIYENIRELVREVDIETMGQKQFVKKLAKKMNVTKLKKKKRFILESLTKILNENEDEDESDGFLEESAESVEEDEDVAPSKKKARNNKGEPKKVSPFNAPKELSKQLADFFGQGSHMSRPQVVKHMWAYIKENRLQNPEKKSEIFLDDNLKKVFEVDKFTMFQMNKYLSVHIYPFKPLPTKEEEEANKEEKAKERARKKKVRKKQKNPTKRKFPLFRLSEALAEVTGSKIMTRQRVTKELNNYIKEHDLQNPEDRRQILCDDLLTRIMDGQEKVTYFSMQKYISPHLLEKVGIDEGEDPQPVAGTNNDDGYSS